MVISKSEMKRKRKEGCSSPLLDDSPKRTKVHAQRKFAQGSNVNSPVITPVKEIEKQEVDVLPEPVELLPIKRPNTEDFLTFLCFRGTPILPPNLNFFNTASIVDNNGQVLEIKSESPKNGPIDTSVISKAGQGSAERPFIAFGVRKRADPIVISRQMDKKRRHALALQALRRKYQEQRMAKIRAVTISKLSEKVTSKSSSVSKTETVTKKTNTVPKTKIPEVSTKRVKVVQQQPQPQQPEVKTTLRSQIKPKMCLRSFRGRFVQKELQFRNVKKRPLPLKKLTKTETAKKNVIKKSEDEISEEEDVEEEQEEEEEESASSEYGSDDERASKSSNSPIVLPKIAKKSAPGPKKPSELNLRVTRSNKLLNSKIVTSRRQQIKQQLLSTPKTTVKPRTLRSHTQKLIKSPEMKSRLMQLKVQKEKEIKKEIAVKKFVQRLDVTKYVPVKKPTLAKNDSPKPETVKKPTAKAEPVKKVITKAESLKKIPPAKDVKAVISKPARKFKIAEVQNKEESKIKTIPKPVEKDTKIAKKIPVPVVKKTAKPESVKKEPIKKEVKEELSCRRDDSDSKELESKSQRPSRKTKEAAAIYMELLSQKLVNESKIDDDNVSIDSFPELPNVKRTEQRENELKAKAKCNKSAEREIDKKTTTATKSLKETDKKKILNEKKNEPLERDTKKTTGPNLNPSKKEEQQKKDDEKPRRSPPEADNKKKTPVREEKLQKIQQPEVTEEKMSTRESAGKRKYSKKIASEASSESEESLKQHKVRKSEEKTVEKRQTRNSSQNLKQLEESEDSDESFRVDIKIPRKKQVTRSKVVKKYEESELEDNDSVSSVAKPEIKKSSRTKPTSYLECSSSESDVSTTSDVKPPSKKPKKFTKTKPTEKHESFSDSDEEPLSKLTQNKSNPEPKEVEIKKEQEKTKTTEKPETKVEEKVVATASTGPKPKRECAKRPQNYLPMFSSSDEESLFQGYQTKSEPKSVKKTPEAEDCPHIPPALELKDISRRFGKGKVNMSNEQIEKWLNDAAMAGNCVRNENDEMLKFGEKIPTETSFSVAGQIDTEKLKTLLVNNVEKPEVLKKDLDELSPKTSEDLKLLKIPSLLDKKIIFRNKDKLSRLPNAKAFSANNESSVYAFGEEDDLMKAPFRRPARRPSSTATSRSEDELSKYEEIIKTAQFRKPSLKQEFVKIAKDESSVEAVSLDSESATKPKTSPVIVQKIQSPVAATSMVPPANVLQKCNKTFKQTKSFTNSETSEEFKYKVPSSPSASSSSSAKLYKKQNNNKPKVKQPEVNPVNLAEFPTGNVGHLVEAPVFHPNEKEFQDPLEYIEKIRVKAEQFGICRIVPPANFKPECKVTDDMRFTAYNQYVHKMLHRWGPNFKELMAIKKYLSTQNISLTHPPWIGGMEIDLPRLYQTVQSLGGLKEVIEKKKWSRVSEAMKIPKSAQDRVTKLDDIYCKYLLPYDTLSPAEREKLFDEVETEWAKRESKNLEKPPPPPETTVEEPAEEESESESDDEIDECIVKGRSMALNAFYRIARNTMSMWFKTTEPTAEEVEQEFWRHVQLKQNHICVHSGSIDSGNWGYGFAVSKNSPFARHAWNLKVLTNNSGSVLRSMGPVMGVTVPTLHVGMVFSSCCWYRDPHGLPWIEYLHTGGNKIWYGIPDSTSESFHVAMKKMVPNCCHDKRLWLSSDTVMVPPNLLVENGVSLCRTVQEPGQFIVVFPKAFTSSLSTGYVVSESVYFAPPNWLHNAKVLFDELRNSCEPSMFSFDRLLLSIINDARSTVDVLNQIIPAVQALCDKEKVARGKVREMGVSSFEKLPLPDARKKKKLQDDEEEYECEICRMNLFVSMITETENDGVYCLDHAIEELDKKSIESKNCKLSYTYDDKDLEGLIEKIQTAIANKLQKKIPNKYAGMPTLLTK